MNESEITRQLTTFEELVKHLATKEELLLLRVEMHKLHTQLILWIIGSNLTVGGGLLALMLYLHNLKP